MQEVSLVISWCCAICTSYLTSKDPRRVAYQKSQCNEYCDASERSQVWISARRPTRRASVVLLSLSSNRPPPLQAWHARSALPQTVHNKNPTVRNPMLSAVTSLTGRTVYSVISCWRAVPALSNSRSINLCPPPFFILGFTPGTSETHDNSYGCAATCVFHMFRKLYSH